MSCQCTPAKSRPSINGREVYLTGNVIDALARKGKVLVVVDGLTAANDLGLTDAVPARIGILSDGRLRPITLGNPTLHFQAVPPCPSCRRSIGCATCFRPTTEATASTFSPSSEIPIKGEPFRTICAATYRPAGVDAGSWTQNRWDWIQSHVRAFESSQVAVA